MHGGIILLDDEYQRTLYDTQRSSPPDSDRSFPHHANEREHPDGGRYEPRTDFTSRPVPRTDFTTHQAELRTDFTTKREPPRMEGAGNQGLPRTDFTTVRRTSGGDHSAGKPSMNTHRSSGTVPTALDQSDAMLFENRYNDSYPILRDDDPTRESSTGSAGNNATNEYAGTSSGLRISARLIMAGVIIGSIVGIVLSELKISSLAAQWISMPGDLYMRALKCLVVPYVFCSVAVAVGDIVFVGKGGVIGWQTAKIFVIFWFTTVTMGVTIALIFRPFFRINQLVSKAAPNNMGFFCANHELMTRTENGTLTCSSNATTLSPPTTFLIKDINSIFAKQSTSVASVTLSDQIMQVVTTVVSDNIINSMANARLLSIITFSMLLGSIAGRNYFTRSRRVNYLYLTLLQLRNTFFLLMEWIIWLSPGAVISICAGTFATNRDYTGMLREAYPFVLASTAAAMLQMFVLYPLIVFIMTRTNPYTHMRGMVRAYAFAFSCMSSLATMPVTLSCVQKARMCSQSIANFVISIGVVSGISGMGWYLPIALTFLAESSGNGDKLTALRIVGMFVLSFIACAGTPPIPSASLVVITTAYTTLFGTLPKAAFAYVVAIDIVVDRFSTLCNVNDDIMALKIIAETTDETVAQDQLGERF